MGLSKSERETTIVFSDSTEVAEVYTAQRPMITKLKRNPAATLIEEGRSGTSPWARFEINASLISFRSKQRAPTRGSGQGFGRHPQSAEEAPKAA